MIVTGGLSSSSFPWWTKVIEVFTAAGTSLCTLPPLPLPTGRYGHTQDGLLICGGSDNYQIGRTCVQLSAEGWAVTHNLLQYRWYHSSWMSPAGLVLIGGQDVGGTDTTTELLSSSDSSSSFNFTLEYHIR